MFRGSLIALGILIAIIGAAILLLSSYAGNANDVRIGGILLGVGMVVAGSMGMVRGGE